MAQFQFDARQVEPDSGRLGPVPKGWYAVALTESSIEATNDGVGAYIKGVFTITEGEYKGRKIYHMFNIKNASEKTVEIAYKQLSALSHAVGVLVWQATEQLHNLQFKMRVSVDDKDPQYEPKNVMQAMKAYNDPSAVEAPTVAPKAKVPAGATPGAAQPWTPPANPAAAATPYAPPPGSAPVTGGQPASAWTPPQGAAQPWQPPANGQPAQPTQVAAAAPAQYAAPAQQAPAAPNAGWTPPQGQATFDPNAPAQFAAPVNNGSTNGMSAGSPAAGHVQAPTSYPEAQAAGQSVPPWMQGGAPAQ